MPRVSRSDAKSIFALSYNQPYKFNCEQGTAMKSSIGIEQELMYHLVLSS